MYCLFRLPRSVTYLRSSTWLSSVLAAAGNSGIVVLDEEAAALRADGDFEDRRQERAT